MKTFKWHGEFSSRSFNSIFIFANSRDEEVERAAMSLMPKKPAKEGLKENFDEDYDPYKHRNVPHATSWE